jgi:hypothetical protein
MAGRMGAAPLPQAGTLTLIGKAEKAVAGGPAASERNRLVHLTGGPVR